MSALTDPLELPCGVRLPNRIAKAALSEALGDADNSPDERIVTLYRRWAQGGYGLLITGNIMVDRDHLGEPGNIVIEDDRALAQLTAWTKAAHDGGAAIFAQLNHPGRQSNLLAIGHKPVAPSPVPLAMPGAATPRELTSDRDRGHHRPVRDRCRGVRGGGLRRRRAARGPRLPRHPVPLAADEPARPTSGAATPTRRMRFLIEVVRRVRQRVSPGFAVAVKLNSADFQRGGFTEDDSRAVVAALAGEAVDLIEVSGGNYESPAMGGSAAPATRAREAYFLDYARSVRREAGAVPIAVTGGFRNRTAMDDALTAGDCDLVGIARPTVTATDAAASILDGRTATLTTHEIQAGMRRFLGRLTDLKALDGFLNISWNTDQLHRLARGLEPDLSRGALVTALAMVRRNGRVSFSPKRGLA